MSERTTTDVGLGQSVYGDEGTELGTVRGFDEHGFYVTVTDGVEALSAEHVTAGVAAEAELMWRCWECGEMGDVASMPETCPSWGGPREALYYCMEE
jgi:rubrerythrin